MALTLLDYARGQFPEHHLDAWPRRQSGSHELSDSTLVAHVVGAHATSEVLRALHDGGEGVDIAAVMVRPVEPPVMAHTGEDQNGDVDLPDRRLISAVLTGAAAGVALGVACGLSLDMPQLGLAALMLFTAAAGAALGFIMGGGRFAAHRAVTQPHAPGADIGVVAAFTGDEHAATDLALVLYANDQYDVRIVSPDGAWHAPND